MSSSAPTKRAIVTNTAPPGKGLIAWLKPLLTTSTGRKAITAVTGALLTGFLIVHMVGNLQVLAGPEAINNYAHKLKQLGPLLWVARGGLLTIFVVHLVLALWLAKSAAAARPIAYQYSSRIQATRASLTMHWTGLTILAFTVFHLAHFTFAWVDTTPARNIVTGNVVESNYLDLVDAQGRQDVYSMVVKGYANPYVSIAYIIAMVLLFVHLKHGVGSVFQSLGLNTPRTQAAIHWLSHGLAAIIVIGNIAIVGLVCAGQIPVQPTPMTKADGKPVASPSPRT
jgi:succinate dehydrogenase / fumarate reductase cytochrome b subunit